MSQLSKNPKAPPRYFALDGYRFIARAVWLTRVNATEPALSPLPMLAT